MSPGQFIKFEVVKLLQRSKPFEHTNREACVSNLVFMYHCMRASENLLELAIEHSEGGLKDYFVEHLSEETGHAEWLARDLASAGIDATSPPRLAVEMVGSMYYLVQHLDAAVLLGYMVLMECFPMSLERVAEMEALHGVELFKTLRYHAEHDVEHGIDVLAQIDALPERQQQLVWECATQAARYFAEATHSFI